jgi:hypothetical protein
MQRVFGMLLLVAALLHAQSSQPTTLGASQDSRTKVSMQGVERITKEVHHELVLLPLTERSP